jgi:uncharacterized protein (TIGR02117 family)
LPLPCPRIAGLIFRVTLTRIFLLAFLLVLAGCASPVPGLYPPKPGQKTQTVYLVDYGWHVGLAVKASTLPPGARPAWSGFRGGKYLEIGWGADHFYRSGKVTSCNTMGAMFLPNHTVLHVVAITDPPEKVYADTGLIRVTVSEAGYERLCAYLAAAYARDAHGREIDLGNGLYGVSRFYSSTGTYYITNTCNEWTARALRSAGAPILPGRCFFAGDVFSQTARFGQVIHKP